MINENLFTPDSIRTQSGIYMNVFDPKPDMIDIRDIAHALSHQCRFGGHLPQFYSVGQHSIACSELVEKEHRLAALLHDASEAYLLDMPSPIKAKLPEYKIIEKKLMEVIAQKFGFQYPLSDAVVVADTIMLHVEWHSLMLKKSTDNGLQITPASPAEVYESFIQKYEEITGKQAGLVFEGDDGTGSSKNSDSEADAAG